MSHFRDVCSCGTLIAQCRCIDPTKTTRVRDQMRSLTDHIVAGDSANRQLAIAVMDAPGQGGASHLYRVSEFDASTNGSNPLGSHPFSESWLIFQNGPIKEFGVNGVTQEALLAIVIDRLRSFQAGPFACDMNAIALLSCQHALEALQVRTHERIARGVEGKTEK